jgi:hypothetical protein
MVPHGSGIMHFMNGDMYEGELVYGEMRGNNVTYTSHRVGQSMKVHSFAT